jgi:hypothetical protein
MARYSVENGDIGTVVFFNGVKVFDVVECDTCEGWIVTYKRKANGDLAIIGDEIQKEKFTGAVTVQEAKA